MLEQSIEKAIVCAAVGHHEWSDTKYMRGMIKVCIHCGEIQTQFNDSNL